MKRALLLAALLALPLLASASYDGSWHRSEFWSGEYPNGFSVVKKGVVLSGRSEMNLDSAPSLSCAVPFKAVFHAWNSERPAEYVTYSKIVPMTAKADLILGEGEGEGAVTVKAGETFEYLVYGSEGWFIVRYQGKEYDANQDLLEKVTYDEALLAHPQDEWTRISCENGGQAWIFLRDLYSTNEEGEVSYLPGVDSFWRGFREYGRVTDLTERDLDGDGNGK